MIGRALARKGHPVGAVACRGAARAAEAVRWIGAGTPETRFPEAAKTGDIVLLTVPDDAVAAVCAQVNTGRGFAVDQFVIHCCGGLSSEVLGAAAAAGALTASMHPMQSFATPDAARLDGVFWAYEGDPEALPLVERMIEDLGGRGLKTTREGKALYHAGAVVASNYLVTLYDEAVRLLASAGIARDDAGAALAVLMEGTLANLKTLGSPAALTGPVARGDAAMVARHLAALPADARELYAMLGLRTVEVAVRKGSIGAGEAEGLRKVLGEVRARPEGRRRV